MKKTIVFATSEALPFVKTGGLADVSFSLVKHLAEAGHTVYLVMPRYYRIDKVKYRCRIYREALGVPMPDGEKWAGVYASDAIPGVYTIFIEHDSYFGRDGLYDDGYCAYGDNAARFSFFSRAVIQLTLYLGIQPDIFHCNDWQTALIPVYLKNVYLNHESLANAKSVLSIHNMGYQGVFGKQEIEATGLGWSAYNEHCLKFYDGINFLKSGLLYADAVTTVSSQYAEEIQTPEFGYDLAGILRSRRNDLFGITNGADLEAWDPSRDTLIPATYSASEMGGKLICKRELQARTGLYVDDTIPLCGTVSRITHQKGIDIIIDMIERMSGEHSFQYVLLGSGDDSILSRYREIVKQNPGRFALIQGYDEELSHCIEAGTDIYLMPSRYEPCGLNQIYSMIYGSIPVVRCTGGLADTVDPWNETEMTGTGFLFNEMNPAALSAAFIQALSVYHNETQRKKIIQNGMKKSFGWNNAAHQYVNLYNSLLSHR